MLQLADSNLQNAGFGIDSTVNPPSLAGAITGTQTIVAAFELPTGSNVVGRGWFEFGGLFMRTIGSRYEISVIDSAGTATFSRVFRTVVTSGKVLVRVDVVESGGTVTYQLGVIDSTTSDSVEVGNAQPIATGQIRAPQAVGEGAGPSIGVRENWSGGSARNINLMRCHWLLVTSGAVSDNDLEAVWSDNFSDGYRDLTTVSTIDFLLGPQNTGVADTAPFDSGGFDDGFNNGFD